MGVILVPFLLVAVALLLVGFLLFRSAFRKPRAPDAAVPIAKVVDGSHTPIRDRQAEPHSSAGVAARAVGGMAIMGAGGALLYGVIDVMQHGLDLGMGSKGRLLRIRGDAQLPERALGDGWHDDAAPAASHLGELERRLLAEAWLLSARMEHASIAAFAQLSLHLAALGAPSELAVRTHVAAQDEIRHARRCFALARAFGGEAFTAGPIAGLARGDGGEAITRTRLAIGTLVDGCLAEGIAADVTAHAARGAEDPVIRDALAMIARDEATHAELAWSVLAWCLEDRAIHAAVAARIARLDDELAPRGPELPGVDPAWLAAQGLLDQDTIGAIAAARIAATRARAAALVAAEAARACG